MIIKVMTRKEPSFRQLIDYVNRDAADARYVLTHNLMEFDRAGIATEFEANAKLLRSHVNGTVMFHDILSITRSKSLGLERQKQILKDIALDYIARRAPDHLVYAGLHEDHAKHLHYHFIISANPVGEWKRAHLSKPQLRTLQTEMETRVLTRYPDLEQKPAMARKTAVSRLSQPGQELKRRTGKVPERQRVTDTLSAILNSAHSESDLFARLTDAKLELYRRGKSTGVRDLETGRNHRLDTLGLSQAFESLNQRLSGTHHVVPTTAAQHMPPATSSFANTPIDTHTRPPPTPTLKTSSEPDMDLLQLAANGLSAIADALSIAPASLAPVEEETRKVKAAVAKTIEPHHEQTAKLHLQPKPAAKTAAKPLPPVEPLAVQTRSVQNATRNALDPDLTPEAARALTDARQAMVEERLSEMADTRQQQEAQRSEQQDSRLRR